MTIKEKIAEARGRHKMSIKDRIAKARKIHKVPVEEKIAKARKKHKKKPFFKKKEKTNIDSDWKFVYKDPPMTRKDRPFVYKEEEILMSKEPKKKEKRSSSK